ncbi:MAG: hypothetical protein U0932_07200 [Thiobacillus sp.]|nr:hypothetical protein [Thiobacillus sp.]
MTSKKQTLKARGKRGQTIRVTTSGKPPLSGAVAFARLLAKVNATSP